MKENELHDDIPCVIPFINKYHEYIAVCPHCEADNEIYPIDYDLAHEQQRYSEYECWSCDESFYVGPKEKNIKK